MKTIWPKIALLVLCCAALGSELWHFRSSRSEGQQPGPTSLMKQPPFVLLPQSEAAVLARFFTGPDARIEPWEPTVGDMDDVEASRGQIPLLSSKYPETYRHIDAGIPYFRQYGAVIIDARKFFVVNGFCPSAEVASGAWRKHLVLANGGGNCHWKALFDVSTHKFTELAVNAL